MATVTGKTGTFNISSNNPYISGYVQWRETYDSSTYIATNKTKVEMTAYLHRTNIHNEATYITNTPVTRIMHFGNEQVSNTSSVSFSIPANASSSGGEYITVYSASKEIPHNADGTKSISLGFHMWNDVEGVAGNSFRVATVRHPVQLTTIPRASTFKSVSGNTIGGYCTVTLNVSSSSFTHRLWYKVGNSGWYDLGVHSAGSDIVSFVIAEETVNQLSTATSGTMQLCVRTMNGATQVGNDVYKDVTVYVPDYNNENIQITFWGMKLLNGILVEGKSFLSVNAYASADPGASIVSCVSTIDGKEYYDTTFDTSPLSAGYHSIRVTAVDSRGKTYTASSDAVYVEPYNKPSVTKLLAERDSDTPTTVYVEYQGSVSWLNGQNTISAKVTLNGKTETIPTNNNSASGTVTFYNVPTDDSLTVTGEITDYYTTEYKEIVLGTMSVTMDFYSTGKGIAIGKVAEGEGLEVDWEATFNEQTTFNKQTTHDGGMICNNRATINNKALGDFVIYKQHSGIDTHLPEVQNFAGITFKNFNTGSTVLGRIGMNDNTGLKRLSSGGAEYLVLDTGNMDDYIESDVKYGTSGVWTYRKWNNGFAECFGYHTVANLSISTAWGSLYASPAIALPSFPFTFVGAPEVHISWESDFSALVDGVGKRESTKAGQTYLYRPVALTSVNGRFSIYAYGKWK